MQSIRLFRRTIVLCASLSLAAIASPLYAAVASQPFTPGAIEFTLPAGHDQFSVVIDDATGVRVRNLLSFAAVTKYQGTNGVITVSWDGKDDDGQSVPAGTYTARGVSLPELDAFYEYSFYNPGDPPWNGYPNSHWGSNHGDPITMACVPAGVESPWRTVVGYNGSEGTDYIIAIGKNDRKVWGLYEGWGTSWAVTIDGAHLYVATGKMVKKYKVVDGSIAGFKRTAGTVPQTQLPGDIFSLAVRGLSGTACLRSIEGTPGPQLLFFNSETGRTNLSVTLPSLMRLAYSPAGELWGTSTNDAQLVQIGQDGVITPVTLPGLERPAALTFDAAGNLVVMDRGADWQIKIYTPDRKLLRTVGVKGGGRDGWHYKADGVLNVNAIAVDERGYVWTSEGGNPHPRRQAVWDLHGKMVKDFVGSTFYNAWGCTVHDQDTTLVSVQDAIFRVDPKQVQDYRMERFVWSGRKPGSPFAFEDGNPWCAFWRANFFRSKISGRSHEYMVQTATTYPIIYVQKHGDYRPVAAIWTKKPVDKPMNPWSRPGDPDNTTIYVWSDLNEDELIQDNEVLSFQTATKRGGGGASIVFPAPHGLDFYVADWAIKPARFLSSGAPVYEVASCRKLEFTGLEKVQAHVVMDPNNPTRPDQFMLRVGDHLVAGMGNWPTLFEGKAMFMDLTGRITATIPYKGGGVHGSLAYPGPVKNEDLNYGWCNAGVAKINDEVGSVYAQHGYFGQVTFVTEDGIIAATLFKDARANPEGYGPHAVRGKSWKNSSMQQEMLTAWFGRQDDGAFRYMFGATCANVLKVIGLERLSRFTAGQVVIPAGK